MTLFFRAAEDSDLPFLREMLYEAVFWRANPNKPTFEDGLALPEVSKVLANWGEREGDTGIIAMCESGPVGAAWFRYWTDDNPIRGYVRADAPVVVIGVHRDYRHQGIGKKLIKSLCEAAAKQAIERISLSVAKDNVALNLYRQTGFVEHTDIGDSLLMVREI